MGGKDWESEWRGNCGRDKLYERIFLKEKKKNALMHLCLRY